MRKLIAYEHDDEVSCRIDLIHLAVQSSIQQSKWVYSLCLFFPDSIYINIYVCRPKSYETLVSFNPLIRDSSNTPNTLLFNVCPHYWRCKLANCKPSMRQQLTAAFYGSFAFHQQSFVFLIVFHVCEHVCVCVCVCMSRFICQIRFLYTYLGSIII